MPILKYGVGKWDADVLGNHRVVIRVNEPAEAVRVHIPWRRRDQYPEQKRMVLVDALSGEQVTNLVSLQVSRESADLIFQPLSGAGNYYLYFMPYTGTVQAPYPQISYLEPDDHASPAWLEICGLVSTGSGERAGEDLRPERRAGARGASRRQPVAITGSEVGDRLTRMNDALGVSVDRGDHRDPGGAAARPPG